MFLKGTVAKSEQIAKFCLTLGPRMVVLKLGSKGALLATGDHVDHRSHPETKRFLPPRANDIDGGPKRRFLKQGSF
jgi:hypothetical protein